jgi:plasmid replication initiation protein
MTKAKKMKENAKDNGYLVVKSNCLIEANYRLNLTEQRVIFTLCSKIKTIDENFQEYKFKVSDFMSLIEIKDKSKYDVIPKVCGNLMKRVLRIIDDKKILIVSWLSSAEYIKGSGEVILSFDPKLKPYLLQLKSDFTKLDAREFYQLRSFYAQRIYELLKQYEKIGERIFRIDELRKILGILDTEYKKYNDFKRNVIFVSQKELKSYTNIEFDFEEVKEGRKIVAIKFKISKNKTYKHIEDINKKEELNYFDFIKKIQKEFQSTYNGMLIDKFVYEMIDKKGIEHVENCLKEYEVYIQGRTISNIAGDFYTFVMNGYEKPVGYKRKPMYADFDQREYSEEDYKKFYANLNEID